MKSERDQRSAAATYERMLAREVDRMRRLRQAEPRNRQRLPPAFQAPRTPGRLWD